jgi:hypothetical protein
VFGGKRSVQVKPTPNETPIRNTSRQATGCLRIKASPQVLMLLIQMCLRWLMPVASGIESPAERAIIAHPAIKKIANQHRIWLAPIHAPPPSLSLS